MGNRYDVDIILYLSTAKRQPSGKDQNTQKKKEELEKRLDDVSEKLGMPKKPKKSKCEKKFCC